jgi:hypothetical protein
LEPAWPAFVDEHGNITGCSERAGLCAVDANPIVGPTSGHGDNGCGVKYFSQDGCDQAGAPQAGIELSAAANTAGKLKIVQKQMEGRRAAAEIYKCIDVISRTPGVYNNFTK